MIISEEGQFAGSVSGGCIEADVIQTAGEVFATGQNLVRTYGFDDAVAWQQGLSCGGQIQVHVCTLTRESLSRWAHFAEESGWVRWLLYNDGDLRQIIAPFRARGEQITWGEAVFVGDVPNDVFRRLQTELPQAMLAVRVPTVESLQNSEGGQHRAQISPPPLQLAIVGATHIAQHVIDFALPLGYRIAVIDPRAAWTTADRFSHLSRRITMYADYPDECLPDLLAAGETALVTLSHDEKIDDPALVSALTHGAAYIGCLGSHRTHARRVERLSAQGFSNTELARLHAPVGLPLGGRTAPEIALSVVAELTAWRHGQL